MKIATTTMELSSNYPGQHLERVKKIHEAGFNYVDLSFFLEARPDSAFLRDDWQELVAQLKTYGQENGVSYVQAHCPAVNPLRAGERYEFIMRSTVRSLEVCGMLGIPNAVIHWGLDDGISKEESFERNYAFLKELIPVLEKTGVNLCFENSSTTFWKESFYPATGRDMRDFLEYVGHPLVNACWDTGHGNLEGPQYNEIVTLGRYLKAVHINDNRGVQDEHMLPFMGTISMDEIMSALLAIDYKGYFTLEAIHTTELPGGSYPSRRVFAGDDRLAAVPLAVKETMLKAGYEIAKAILVAYDCYEE